MATNLKSFGNFLKEDSSDIHVFAYGRFQPPTIGHQLLIRSVEAVSRQYNTVPHVYVSKSHDNAKNPLSCEERLRYLNKMFPSVKFHPALESFDAQGRKTTGIIGILQVKASDAKHAVIVCGPDRVDEFAKKTAAQNGKLYSYESIRIVPIGERNVESDGLVGMSGTKMRAAAHSMDYETFRAGIPSTLSNNDTRELMMTIRKSMSIRESFTLPTPKVSSQSNLKAVFLLGVPGSGKDFILDKALSQHGLTEAKSDEEATKLLAARKGIILNGNADDFDLWSKRKSVLENMGYSCKAIFVSTSNNVSKKRNLEREARGGRVTAESIRESKWNVSMSNRDKFAKLFGESHFIEFDNSTDLRDAADVTRKRKTKELLRIFNEIRLFVGGSISKDINVLFEQELLNENVGMSSKKFSDYRSKKHEKRKTTK